MHEEQQGNDGTQLSKNRSETTHVLVAKCEVLAAATT
jgi:hypothetical protein